ncbi:MAG: type II secretion system protein [Sulfurovaceae bacterium]|nr:type II secretion system protein [Sulfurovaceae bacterium]
MRKAFSMVTAIFVIVLLATISMLVLNMAATTTHNTTTQYRHEQAALYAKSYTELAIMSVLDYNRTKNNNCVNTIHGTIGNYNDGSGYEVNTIISYIGNGTTANSLPPCSIVLNTLSMPSVPLGSVPDIIIDVYVIYKDPEHIATSGANAPAITYHRRTLQKI